MTVRQRPLFLAPDSLTAVQKSRGIIGLMSKNLEDIAECGATSKRKPKRSEAENGLHGRAAASLHPLSVAELGLDSREGLEALLKLGGFPERFLSGSETEARRWSNEYRSRLVREDLVSLEQVQDIGTLELLMTRLPESVGSLLSARLENLVASHLLKLLHFSEDTEGYRTELRYLKARFPKTDAWQVAAGGQEDYVTREGIRVAPALELLRTLV